MSYTFDMLFKARQEIFEAWKWYEEQKDGLGERFEAEVFKKISLIVKHPLQYPLKNRTHEVSINDFPFLIVYRINEKLKLVMIVSVFHMSRHPKRKY